MFETKSAEEILKELNSEPSGLSDGEAAARLEKEGPNELSREKPPTALQRFFGQLKDPLIYVLLVAAAASIALGEYSDAVIILCVVLMNALVGMIQEGRAQQSLEALKKMSAPTAAVMRSGKAKEIPASQLVPGDIVLLEAGRIIPADLRLMLSSNLKTDESALTGESVPVEKDAGFVSDRELPAADRHNMAYSGTSVTYGRGSGVVVATGQKTEFGKIAAMLQGGDEMTPLQKNLAVLGKMLGILTIVLCAGLFLIAVLQHRDVLQMLMTAISLAVAAVPEGLPAVVTIVLAMGVQRMVKVNSIVRRLPAVETLGAVNVVCSDKTGTLTQNRMTVDKVYTDGALSSVSALDPVRNKLFLEGFVLCNDAEADAECRMGDPTELALLDMGNISKVCKSDLEKVHPRVDEKPFDSDRKMMTTRHTYENGPISFTKGAVDRLLPLCTKIRFEEKIREIRDEDKSNILNAAGEMSSSALRVLALAARFNADTPDESDLTFIGLVGMIDPARPEARAAVENLRGAGITTVMITGDHCNTAFAIAKQLGIADSEDQCMTGDQIDAASQEELTAKIPDIRVFARVSPEHKVRIVNALRANGNIVSMTGDGVNDAPSLKAADIGVAMGITGTDVAKNAADMVLTDDNFATIRNAVEEGRGIYSNIKKTVLFLLSSNLGEVISMFCTIAAGLAAPLKAVHILWINLITDMLPALALGSDDKPRGLMKKKPRRQDEGLFADGGLFMLIFYGVLIAFMTLAAFLWTPVSMLLAAGRPVSIASLDEILIGDTLAQSQTYAFIVLSVSELWHSLGMRDVDTSIFVTIRHTKPLMFLSFFLGIALQAVATEIPSLSNVFGTVSLEAPEWFGLVLFAALPLVFHEVFIPFRRMIHRKEEA